MMYIGTYPSYYYHSSYIMGHGFYYLYILHVYIVHINKLTTHEIKKLIYLLHDYLNTKS